LKNPHLAGKEALAREAPGRDPGRPAADRDLDGQFSEENHR
jgi:hypothetical protein